MERLILDDSQLQLVNSADGPLIVRDGRGRDVGVLIPASMCNVGTIRLSEDELDKLADRMSMENVAWSTTEEVVERLKSRTAQ